MLPSAKGRLHQKEPPPPPPVHVPPVHTQLQLSGHRDRQRDRNLQAGWSWAFTTLSATEEMIRREKSPRTQKKWSHHQTPQPHWHSKSTIFNKTSVYIQVHMYFTNIDMCSATKKVSNKFQRAGNHMECSWTSKRIKETKNNLGKFPNIWTVNSILLNNAWVKKKCRLENTLWTEW